MIDNEMYYNAPYYFSEQYPEQRLRYHQHIRDPIFRKYLGKYYENHRRDDKEQILRVEPLLRLPCDAQILAVKLLSQKLYNYKMTIDREKRRKMPINIKALERALKSGLTIEEMAVTMRRLKREILKVIRENEILMETIEEMIEETGMQRVAERLGVAYETLRRMRNKRRKYKRLSKEEEAEIIEMLREGKKMTEIAKILKIAVSTVYYVKKRWEND